MQQRCLGRASNGMPSVAASKHCSTGPSSRFVIPLPPVASMAAEAANVRACVGGDIAGASALRYTERGSRHGRSRWFVMTPQCGRKDGRSTGVAVAGPTCALLRRSPAVPC